MNKDPYAVLGLKKKATDAEIKRAYRKIARKHHPDLNPGDSHAEDRFKAASAAYDLLKDPETRGRFDRGEVDASGAEQAGRRYYRDYAEQPGHPYQSSRGFQDFGDASGIFADILRQQAHGGRQNFKAQGADMRYSLEVDFLEAVKGARKRISLPSGDNLEVAIPKGTADGQTIRLRGKGGEGFGSGPRGDAYVTLSVRPHPIFSREGDDILVTLPISLDEAVLGAKVPTPTIDGSVNLTIPKGASSGQTLRLRGRGISRGVSQGGKSKAGDQRVQLQIVMPPKIDDGLTKFMADWRKNNAYDPRKGMQP